MKKVFWKWNGETDDGAQHGKEYEAAFGAVVTLENGNKLNSPGDGNPFWQRIERGCFEANGHTWFRHTPGDVMPCGGDDYIVVLYRSGVISFPKAADVWPWNVSGALSIIGWRYADSAKPEVACTQIQGREEAVSSDVLQYLPGTTADLSEYIECAEDMGGNDPCMAGQVQAIVSDAISIGWVADPNCVMLQDDMPIAAMDDGHLTPGQKAYINEKEEKVAERLRSEAAKEELKRADHSKSIQDLANANSAVKFEHDHRLGWRQ